MSKAEKTSEASKASTYRIPAGSPWANAWKITAVLGGIGLAASMAGMSSDAKRFAFSWLFAFMTFLAVGLGGLFFVLGQHLTGAGWGVTSRRTAELMLSGLPVFALLFVPIALNLEHLYPWMHVTGHGDHGGEHGGEHGGSEHGDGHTRFLPSGASRLEGRAAAQDDDSAFEERAFHEVTPAEWRETPPDRREGTPQQAEHHHLLVEKSGYFHLIGSAGFFFVRAALYFLAWFLLAYFFVGWSTRQDKERSLDLTKRMQRIAPASTFVFGVTLTFAAVDWMMSLEPTWYSTIFGVQYFAVSAVMGHATIILLTLGLRRAGVLGGAINVEHYHDLGKLLFGFVVFWAYITFSQFMLIWYAGIPEEATYYHLRWWGGGGFKLVSSVLVPGSFAIPFFLLISRNAKRRLGLLAFACVWISVMHVVQMYWLVMPYAEQTGLVETTMRVHWMDIAALLAVGGIYLSVVLWQMTRFPLVPVGDPRIARALNFHNA